MSDVEVIAHTRYTTDRRHAVSGRLYFSGLTQLAAYAHIRTSRNIPRGYIKPVALTENIAIAIQTPMTPDHSEEIDQEEEGDQLYQLGRCSCRNS